MRDFFFSCIITLSSSTALYAMEPGEPKLAEHFNIKDHSDAGISDSRREARCRSTNDILEELQQSLLKDAREQKEIAKEHRKALGNTKEIIITSFIGFIDQLKCHLETESKDKSYISDLLEQERNHLLNLAKTNNVSVSTDDATKTGDIPFTDSSDSEESELSEEAEIDLLASFLLGDLPENARMWLNNAINEKDAFWKGKSLIKAFDAFKDKIDLDKSQEMAAGLVEYFLTSADNTADLTYKSNALCWAAYIAEHFEWKELMQRAYKEAFNCLIKQSNSVSYSNYSNDFLTSLSLNSHPLAEVKVMLKQVNDKSLRVSLSLLIAAHLKECADKVHPLCWKARFLYHATTCLMDEQEEREDYKYHTLLTYTELIEKLNESYGSKAIPSMFCWFNRTAMSLQSEEKWYDQILQKLKSLYQKYFRETPYKLSGMDKIKDEIKIALYESCFSQLNDSQFSSFVDVERALEICETLQDPQLQCGIKAKILQSYSKMLLSRSYPTVEPKTLARKVDEAFKDLSNIKKDDKLSLDFMHAYIRLKLIERAQSFLYPGSDLYHIASSEARIYTQENYSAILREGVDNWFTQGFKSCEQITDKDTKDQQIVKILNSYIDLKESYGYGLSQSLQLPTILETLDNISSPTLKEETVRNLVNFYLKKYEIDALESISKKYPSEASPLINEQLLYSKERPNGFDIYKTERVYTLALDICQLIPKDIKDQQIVKILNSYIDLKERYGHQLSQSLQLPTILETWDNISSPTLKEETIRNLINFYRKKYEIDALESISKKYPSEASTLIIEQLLYSKERPNGFDIYKTERVYTLALDICQLIPKDIKDQQIVKILNSYIDLKERYGHQLSQSLQLPTILETLDNISSSTLKEETVRNLFNFYQKKYEIDALESISKKYPSEASTLIIEQLLYSKERANNDFAIYKTERVYTLALDICQLIPAEQSRNELIDKILSSLILLLNDGISFKVTEEFSQAICQILDIITDETIRNRVTENLSQAYKQTRQTIGLTAINKRLGVTDSI